jgi:hypothetical protein
MLNGSAYLNINEDLHLTKVYKSAINQFSIANHALEIPQEFLQGFGCWIQIKEPSAQSSDKFKTSTSASA